jgi:hypothetical protein
MSLLKMYFKIPIYGQQTKQFLQQLRYLHALIQPKVIVNIHAMIWVILHNSNGYIRDGQQNSWGISNLNNTA